MTRFEQPGDDTEYAIDNDGAVYTLDGTCVGNFKQFESKSFTKKRKSTGKSPKKSRHISMEKLEAFQSSNTTINKLAVDELKRLNSPAKLIQVVAAIFLALYKLEDIKDLTDQSECAAAWNSFRKHDWLRLLQTSAGSD